MRKIHPSCLSTRLPITFTLAVTALLRAFDAPGWAWGVFGTLMVIVFIGAGSSILVERWEFVPGFGDGKDNATKT